MKNILIVFSGKAQSGKSTSSEIIKQIVNEYFSNYSIQIYSFADKLKQIAKEIFFWDGDKNIYYDISNSKPIPDKGRELLINIGKKMREIRSTVWCEYVMNKIEIEDMKNKNVIFIIDDARFLNEIELIKKFHTNYIIRILRKGLSNINDISETDLDNYNFDYYIENDESVDDLKQKLIKITKKAIQENIM